MNANREQLRRLVVTVDEDLPRDFSEGTSAQLLRVTSSGEIALRSLEGDHPFDALLGFAAPSDWEVLGVVAPGRAVFHGDSDGKSQRVRAVSAVARPDVAASILRFEDGTVVEPPIESGRVGDCLRRAMLMPTPPEPDESVAAVHALAVVAAIVKDAPRLTVRNVSAWLPEPTITTWADARWHAVEHDGNGVMDGALAAWMDDGMYARAMLAQLPNAADMWALTDHVKTKCSAAAWDLVIGRLLVWLEGQEQ